MRGMSTRSVTVHPTKDEPIETINDRAPAGRSFEDTRTSGVRAYGDG